MVAIVDTGVELLLEQYHGHSYSKEGDHCVIDYNKIDFVVFVYDVCTTAKTGT